MLIAGKHSDAEWKSLKAKLESNPTPKLWDHAYQQFYRGRIDTRYLNPITSIKEHDCQQGEGFAIAALFCTLLEFLESCEKGHNFRYIPDNKTKLNPHEYSQRKASRYFKNFLKTRFPFSTRFPAKLIKSFYSDVRCGLLHEARTKGGWTISTEPSGGALVSQKGGEVVLFRNELFKSLEEYFGDYRKRLMTDANTQNAFIRKFDHLCQI